MALWNRLQGAVFGLGIGAAAKDAIDPVLETAKQTSWGQRAVRVLNANQAAEAEARGLGETVEFASLNDKGDVIQRSSHGAQAIDYDDDAKRQGIGAARFEALRRLAQTMPTLQQALELKNRGRIPDSTVDAVISRLGYPTGVRPALKALSEALPPVTDLVRFAVREVYNPPLRKALDLDEEFPLEVLPDAAKVGLSEESTRNYWAAHWELPSYTQLAQMLFRGQLKPEEFRQALKALDYAPTWRGKLEEIAKAIPTLTDMIRFSVREAYDDKAAADQGLDLNYPAKFTTEAAKHGLDADDAKRYWRAHWRYPSPTQAYTMLHRKIIDAGQLADLLKILDYPLPWRKRLEQISYLVPGRIDLRRMYAEKIIDRDEVKLGYERLGYTPDDAETLTKFAVKLAEGTAKEVKRPWEAKAENQLWAALHRAYIVRDATKDQVLSNLTAMGVPDDEQLDVIRLWDGEAAITRARLTPAQLKAAWKRATPNPATGLPWSYDEVLAELQDRGWNVQDARTFLDTGPAPKA